MAISHPENQSVLVHRGRDKILADLIFCEDDGLCFVELIEQVSKKNIRGNDLQSVRRLFNDCMARE